MEQPGVNADENARRPTAGTFCRFTRAEGHLHAADFWSALIHKTGLQKRSIVK